jgi:hypothetical protein
MKSLLSFVEQKFHKAPAFNYKPWTKEGVERIDPLSTLNPDGKKVL